MRKPDLTSIDKMFEKGKNFTLTRDKYIKLTGADTPQNAYYTKNNSALAKHAQKYGYEIEIIPEKIVLRKKQ